MGSVDRKTYIAKLRLDEMLSDHDVSLPADLYDEIVAALREQPEARGVVDVIPEAVRRLLHATEHCLSAADEGVDCGVGRPMLDAMTTLGLLEKTGRGRWAPTGAAEQFVFALTAAQPPVTQPGVGGVSNGGVQQPVQEGGGEVWRCFHCDEAFTDQEAAAGHFGTKLHHLPACQIDPAEYRRMEAKEADYAEEDAACHRAMRGMETQHRLALEREEIKGYERGLRDSGKCPCAAPPSAPVGVEALEARLRARYRDWPTHNSDAEDAVEAVYWAIGEYLNRLRLSLTQQPAQAAPGDGFPRVTEAMARRLDDYLGGEFDIRIGKQAAHAALFNALSAPGDGLKLVPVEPTREMIEAGIMFGNSPNKVAIIYQSMIHAATPPGDDAAGGKP
ncbi:hypothetical protein [Luteimonas saliphila]|uniref:hypothetical protein n=1 Tax=Luteimonas saliphila TaxID=2804919 RepID=UPI00192D1EBE|nr:hypothetical protein [Luteimonas saliphila]